MLQETIALPTTDQRPAKLALAATALYLVWLFWGMRSNPPIPYDKYRSGLTFGDVRELLGHEADAAYDSGQYMFVSRSTVLGRWREMKLDQYARYVDAYGDFGERGREGGDIF